MADANPLLPGVEWADYIEDYGPDGWLVPHLPAHLRSEEHIAAMSALDMLAKAIRRYEYIKEEVQ